MTVAKSTRAIIGAAALVVMSTAMVGSTASGVPDERPLHIDLAANTVTDASGNSLRELFTIGAEAESTTYAVTQSRTNVIITRQSALPRPLGELTPPSADPDKLEKARNHQGVLPRELVGTDYVDGEETQTKTEKFSFQPADPALFQLRFIQAVTPTTAAFGWVPVETAASFRVLRDGLIVAEGPETVFSENGLLPGKTYGFEIQSLDAEGAAVGTRTFPITAIGSALPQNASQVQDATQQQSSLAYRTFIREPDVSLDLFSAMSCGQFGHGMTFGGDDRTFTAPSSRTVVPIGDGTSYRTMIWVALSWASLTGEISGLIRPTKLYKDGELEDVRSASPDGMTLVSANGSEDYAQVLVDHSVGNPFCALGAISYHAWLTTYRSGAFEVFGSRLPAPEHEVYSGSNTDGSLTRDWYPLALDTNHGFICLTGICGEREVYGKHRYAG